jgi:hypothetical protein
MNKKVYEQWVSALRSGEYNQTKGTLKGELPDGGVGYCCLGVLADIRGYDVEKQGIIEGSLSEYASEGPEDVYRDFRETMGDLFVDELVRLNDSGHNFSEIADYIEREMLTDEEV